MLLLFCMGAHFPAVELDNAICFSTLSGVSGVLWHSPKWACTFACFLQYRSGLEVLAYSIDTDFNYVIKGCSLCDSVPPKPSSPLALALLHVSCFDRFSANYVYSWDRVCTEKIQIKYNNNQPLPENLVLVNNETVHSENC